MKRTIGNVTVEIVPDRILGNIDRAQKLLDMMVLKDSNEYVPFLQGQLQGSGHIEKEGLILWDAPHSHYQYEEELYLAINGSSWAKKGETKYPSGQIMMTHTPGTTGRWFEMAKELHLQQWIANVKRIVGEN